MFSRTAGFFAQNVAAKLQRAELISIAAQTGILTGAELMRSKTQQNTPAASATTRTSANPFGIYSAYTPYTHELAKTNSALNQLLASKKIMGFER